jgi:hypothetical protein
MKFKQLFLLSAVVLALTASLAFKAAPQYVVASTPDPYDEFSCRTLLMTNDWCSQYNTGPQCTVYVDASYPTQPAYVSSGSNVCVTPLKRPF